MSENEAKVTIDASHIHKLTGKSTRQCQRIVKTIREHSQKEDWQPVTYFDVAKFFGLPPDDIRRLIF